MTTLGARIKALRSERSLQQRQLAEKAGLTPSMVSQIESGRLTPSLPTLGAVASQPRPAPEAAALLIGQRLTPDLIDAVAGAAFKPGKPLDNTDLTHPYRKKMIRVYVTRALHALA